jgi:hypothetical protein
MSLNTGRAPPDALRPRHHCVCIRVSFAGRRSGFYRAENAQGRPHDQRHQAVTGLTGASHLWWPPRLKLRPGPPAKSLPLASQFLG